MPIFQGFFPHFTGKDKTWQKGGRSPGCEERHDETNAKRHEPPLVDTLDLLNSKLEMGLDIQKWGAKHGDIMKESPLRDLAYFTDNAKHVLNTTIDGVAPNISATTSSNPTLRTVLIDGQNAFLNPFSKKFIDHRASTRPLPRRLYGHSAGNFGWSNTRLGVYVGAMAVVVAQLSN